MKTVISTTILSMDYMNNFIIVKIMYKLHTFHGILYSFFKLIRKIKWCCNIIVIYFRTIVSLTKVSKYYVTKINLTYYHFEPIFTYLPVQLLIYPHSSVASTILMFTLKNRNPFSVRLPKSYLDSMIAKA